MNLQSPTTLLSSIQSMRDRLRSDKLILQDIKKEFSHISKKPRPSPIQTILEESLQDITNHHNLSLRNEDPSLQKKQKAKFFQLKRDHQREILRLKQEHERQLQETRISYQEERKAIENSWRQKFEEQSKYITILQEQVSSPIQSQRQIASHQQYDAVINQLLQENTRLHTHLQQARDQSQDWRKQARKYFNQAESKSRLRFLGKKPIQTNQGRGSQRQRGVEIQKSTKSVLVFNDQNTDRSNFSSHWQDCQIENDQGGLKTIRQFPLNSILNEKPSSRANYMSLKL